MNDGIELPPHWNEIPLEQIASYQIGRTPTRAHANYWAGEPRAGIPWVSIGDMEPFGTITETKERITPLALEQVFRGRKSQRGTLLMSFKLTIGRVATLGIDACHNEAIISIYPKAGVNQKYLEYFLSQVDYADYQDRAVKGNTLNQEKINRIAVAVPPKPEQDKIAALLWKVQKAVEVQDKLVRMSRELKGTAMQRLFAQGLTDESTRDTDYGPVPGRWREEPLGECCYVQTGVTKGRQIDPSEAIEVPYLRVANVQDGRLDLRQIKTITIKRNELEGFLLREGDVVLTEGGDFDKLGRGFIWHSQVPNCVHQNHVFAVRTDSAKLLPEFLAYLVQSPYAKAYFLTVAHKTTNLASINSTKLKALPVLIPSLDEQRDVVHILQALDRKAALHEKKRATLQDLFHTLLPQLMTARIRVDKLDFDTSEVAAC